MRIFSGSLFTETNTFGPMPTGLASFQERCYFRAGQHPDSLVHNAAPTWAARLRGASQDWDLREGLVAAAQPSGTTTRHAYETLRDELLADLRAALPVDVVLLGMHGAMVAEGYDDCEGDLLRHVRQLAGSSAVIGAELDPHSHLSAAMVENADLLIAFKCYPHTDALDRAFELVDLCVATALGKIRPVAAMVDCHMMAVFPTSREPARSFVERMQSLEGHSGVLSISLIHGFALGDVPDMGTKMLVYTDGNAPQADALARQLADEVIAMRPVLRIPRPDIDGALDQALALVGSPIVIADSADNAGGGAASDSSFFLRRMVERKLASAAIGPMWDPTAVRIAFDAGVGARLALRIGGKVGPMSGNPLDLLIEVIALCPAMTQTGLGGVPIAMGNCARVRCGGIDIVLVSQRSQAMGTDLFTRLGCDLQTTKIVVVKSSQHFYAAYSLIAADVLYSALPGSVAFEPDATKYRRIQRPKWPIDAAAA